MVYNAIGIMSGSSLDGLDIVAVELTEIRGQWTYEIIAAECVAYSEEWYQKLRNAQNISVPEYLLLDTSYGRLIGAAVNTFIENNALAHKIHLISSHGHTVYHNPSAHTSTQIGDGATIAAVTNLPTITNLRSKDVALGGQGAPIVPISERLLWSDYHYCLNIGGIANITVNGDAPIAYDICPANQVLNHFAGLMGQEYDDGGQIASKGVIDYPILDTLNGLDYYHLVPPKSLANDYSMKLIEILSQLSKEDALATMCHHIAMQVQKAIIKTDTEPKKMLVTGGGAFNTYLIDQIKKLLPYIEVAVPDANTINYKEAIAMALIGVLRWREEVNVLKSVTGASVDSVGGALWL